MFAPFAEELAEIDRAGVTAQAHGRHVRLDLHQIGHAQPYAAPRTLPICSLATLKNKEGTI